MSDIRAGVPIGAECGSVFEIEDREADEIFRRELKGNVAKTTKAADRDTCSCSVQFYSEVCDGVYLAVCAYHYEVIA